MSKNRSFDIEINLLRFNIDKIRNINQIFQFKIFLKFNNAY